MHPDNFIVQTVEAVQCANCGSTHRSSYYGIKRFKLANGKVLVQRRTRCLACKQRRIERCVEDDGSSTKTPATSGQMDG